MKLIKNEEKYWNFIRELRNTNIGFTEQVNITEQQQKEYMRSHNSDYWICIDNKVPVGFIGIVDNDLRIAASPGYRRKGVGLFMLHNIPRVFNNVTIKVLYDNIASRNMFEKYGLKKKYIVYG